MFYASKEDVRKAKELLLRQPDMFVSMVLYEGSGVAAISSNDVTITPATSPGWVTNALQSTVCINLVIKMDKERVDDEGRTVNHIFEVKVKNNDANSLTFDATLGVDQDDVDDSAGAGTDWTVGETYDFYVMSPNTEYAYGDYFGIVREPAISEEEEMAELVDPVDGLIAEGLIGKTIMISGNNYNVVNNDVLKAIKNLTEVGSQTTAYQMYGGFRPAVRKKFRVAFFGKTDDDKDFALRYFQGKFRHTGELSPNGTEYAFMPWEFRPYADPLRGKDRNAYKTTIQR